ncbi:hypothetical protein SERLADRAFT_433297 [Serpula lacrymans var. lacrymans S7.9]|uniref:Uncharacterized protein n=1 Tax=Serpula lacrymans var. lacrymans (strain S7.9) TaxID=578457 RepID=F8NJ10_SERL9|nr:uncharacterized protein SERLADRAFT_433297 [Serpula lacrymans var. lacrymans S7.9]EGO29291.1 hypothetical protein SERLADRAFT_433297 [Serpula lacrymans var. lacrymans S7.9]
MVTAPSIITQTLTTTGTDGGVTTVTQAIVNPTLNPNSGSTKSSTFFHNTGAVAGVFVLVGLAAASIVLWIFFAIRRKRRVRQLEHDTAVEAAVAAAGFGRSRLDDDNDNDPNGTSGSYHNRTSQFSSEMGQRSSLLGFPPGASASSPVSPAARSSGRYDSYLGEDPEGYDPYAGYADGQAVLRAAREGYIPTRTASPPPGAAPGDPVIFGDDVGTGSRDRHSSSGHAPTHSAGSYEPLLAAYAQSSPPTDNSPVAPSHQRLADSSSALFDESRFPYSTGSSEEGNADERLDPSIRRRTRTDSLGSNNLRDEEDYTRPVLKVRNMPESASQDSMGL